MSTPMGEKTQTQATYFLPGLLQHTLFSGNHTVVGACAAIPGHFPELCFSFLYIARAAAELGLQHVFSNINLRCF